MTTAVRRAMLTDIPHIAQNLRQADRDEINASTRGHIDPAMALVSSTLASEQALVITVDGLAEAIGGIGKDGLVWLVGTDSMTSQPLRSWLLRNSRRWVEHLNSIYPLLHNRVDARNKAHIRWLKFCGFTFIKRLHEGGAEFLSFVRIQSSCAP